eukprot:scaffold311839_cov33-Tisochrysis_lutea.AAC.1
MVLFRRNATCQRGERNWPKTNTPNIQTPGAGAGGPSVRKDHNPHHTHKMNDDRAVPWYPHLAHTHQCHPFLLTLIARPSSHLALEKVSVHNIPSGEELLKARSIGRTADPSVLTRWEASYVLTVLETCSPLRSRP